MKVKLFIGSLMLFVIYTQAHAIRPIEDFRAPNMVQEVVVEKLTSDVGSVPKEEMVQEEIKNHVEQIRELLKLDELNRENNMREALRQENLDDRIRGHEDLELAIAEKNVDLHMGKVLTDMHGNRVRMEEYILRPANNQVQFLNLTMRENRLDYVDYNAYFNTALPIHTHGLWRKNFGWIEPEIYLTKESVVYSNLDDSVKHAVNYFDPTWVTEMQEYVLPVEQSTLHVNDTLKYGVSRTTHQEDLSEMPDAVGVKDYNINFIDQNVLAVRETYTFNDDTFLTSERFIIAEDGSIKQLRWYSLQDWIYWIENFEDLVFNSYKEIIWTASEFEGRNIDVVSQFIHLENVFDNDGDGIHH